MPRQRRRDPTPDFELPPAVPPSAIALQLRRDVRMAVIAQFCSLFAPHVNLEYSTEDLEQDLDDSRPLNCVPRILGKLINTLANDRNTNASNWLPGLRRAYARRLPKGVDNPFVRIVRVPVAAPSTEARQPDSSNTTEETSQDKLPDGLGSESAAVKTESGEHGQISDKSTASTKDVPELDDKNVKMATDSSANTTATSSTPAPIDKQLESQSAPDPATPNQDYYEDYIEVDWSEVALDTKIQAIYNIVSWHMNDAERFRRHLKWEDDLAWRLEPFGRDSEGNEYYYMDDNRVWIHRSPPPARRAAAVVAEVRNRVNTGKGKAKNDGKSNARLADTKKSSRVATGTGASTSRSRGPAVASEAATRKRPLSPEPAIASPSKRTRTTNRSARAQGDGWEEIPAELKQEWARATTNGRKTQETTREASIASSSSTLTTQEDGDESALSDLSESEPGEESADEAMTQANRRLPSWAQVNIKDVEQPGEDGLLSWERSYWNERRRIDGLAGFIEWEAVAVTRDDYQELSQRWATSKVKEERAMHRVILKQVLPAAQQFLDALDAAKLQELTEAYRRHSSRLIMKESEEDERARIIAESEKMSRASRHKIFANLANDAGHTAASDAGSSTSVNETREERSRKREEEKRAKELAAEQAQLEEIRRLEREAAIEANGGVVPPGMETPAELEQMRLEREKEEKRLAREEARIAREEQARLREEESKAMKREAARARAAAKKAEADARAQEMVQARLAAQPPAREVESGREPGVVALFVEEPPWYLACEVCKTEGWNLDNGAALICCDQCEEWQHLPCHAKRDQDVGRPAIDYTADDFSFVCEKCQQDPARKARRAPKKGISARKPGRPPGRRPGRPKNLVQSPPKERKTAMVPGRQHQNDATTVPGPGQPQLSYDALKELIQSQPELISQLPRPYQEHFSQLLGVPVPDPGSEERQTQPASAATNSASTTKPAAVTSSAITDTLTSQ